MKVGEELCGCLVLGRFDSERLTVQKEGRKLSLWECKELRAPEELERLLEESDPNLAGLLDFQSRAAQSYALTERLEGPLLKLGDQPLSDGELVEVIGLLINGLVALHDQELCHGHLREGCLVGQGSEAKMVGQWQAPPPSWSLEDDLIAAGRLIHHLASGRPKTLQGLATLRPAFHRELAAFIDQASQPPGFESARKMAAAFHRALQGGLTHQTPAEPAPTPGVYLSFEAVAGLLLVGLGLIGFLLFQVGGSKTNPKPSPNQAVGATATPLPSPTPPAEVKPSPVTRTPELKPPPTRSPSPMTNPELTPINTASPAARHQPKSPKAKPRYPKAKSRYPKARPKPAPSRSSKKASLALVINETARFRFRLPDQWEVISQAESRQGQVLHAKSQKAEGVSSLTVHFRATEVTPSRWKSSFSLKQEQDDFERTDPLGRSDLSFLRHRGSQSRLATVFVRRRPYYEYGYLTVVIEASQMERETFLSEAGNLLESLDVSR